MKGAAIVCVLGLTAPAWAQSFQLVGAAPGSTTERVYGLSDDGTVAVGYRGGVGLATAYRWSQSGGQYDIQSDPSAAPYSIGWGVSGNGGVVVGHGGTSSSNPVHAFRWSGPGTYQALPMLPLAANVRALDADYTGSAIVGYADMGIPNGPEQAFRWTAATGTVGLGFTRPGSSQSRAEAVNGDGSIVVGHSFNFGPGIYDAFRWIEGEGMQVLPDLDGVWGSQAYGVNGSGTVIVGTSGAGPFAAMWRDGSVMNLGLAPGWGHARGSAVNQDGTVVVGFGMDFNRKHAAIWTPANGMEPLANYLARHGVVVPAGLSLLEATSVSADGLTIGGFTGAPGARHGFVATIPAPAALVLLGLVTHFLAINRVAIRPRRGKVAP